MSAVTEHCYNIGLWIYHTNWVCFTLDYESWLCFLISFLFLVRLYTCRVPDSVEQLMRNTVPVHDIIWPLYVKGDYNSVKIAKSSIVHGGVRRKFPRGAKYRRSQRG